MPDLTHIAPDLRTLAQPVDSLTEYPGNPRRGNVPAIVGSLERFGQQAPVIVQKSTGHVIAGNHVLQAARQLGWTHLAAAIVDVDDEQARAYLLADNRLSDLAVYDTGALVALLQQLDAEDALSGTGFTRAELTALMLSQPEQPEAEEGDEPTSSTWDGPALRTVVLLMPIAKADEFLRWCAFLRGTYGTGSTAATILSAVQRQAQA